MLIVKVLGPLLGLMLRSLLVKEVLALGLSELVDFGTGEAYEHLLGELMRDGFACNEEVN